jgi:hypothetical protein
MTNRNSAAPDYFRPEEVQEMFGIKKTQYYDRMRYLGIKANRDSEGKSYLVREQIDLLEELDEYIKKEGKMSGFEPSHNGASLVRTDDSNLTASTNSNEKPLTPEIYVEPEEPVDNSELGVLLREAEELRAREIAMRDLIKRKLADNMSEEDLPPDLQEKVRLAREAANPKFTPQEVATSILQQWRAKRNKG